MRKSRLPLGSWKRGQVLRVVEAGDGVSAGLYVFLGADATAITVGGLCEDDAGDLRETGETYQVEIEQAGRFHPVLRISGVEVAG